MRSVKDRRRDSPGRLIRFAPGFFLVSFTLLAYVTGLRGVFVLDDTFRILENPVVRVPDLSWDRFLGLFWFARPLSDFTLRLNFQLGGFETWGYHVFNISVHALAALALMGFARLCFRLAGSDASLARTSSFGLALIWAVHPLLTQAVTYIYQRAESLAGLFFLLTLYCAARGLSAQNGERGRVGWLSASVAACAIGHLCKQTLFAAPVAVLTFDYCFIGGTLLAALRRTWRFYLALSATWLVGLGLILATTADESVGYSVRNVTVVHYLFSQAGVILHYVRLSLWPDVLLLDYHWPVARTLSAILPPLLVVLAILAATLYALRRPEPRWRAMGFVGAWFFITLAVTSSFFPIKDLAVEHRMYLALASVAALFVVVLNQAVRSVRTRLGLILALALVLGIRTSLRNEDYNDPYALWGSVLARVPENPRALNELGNLYRNDGRLSEALVLYERALRAEPEDPGPHLNVGLIQVRFGNLRAAEWHYRQAIRKRPSFAEAYLDLGNLLVAQGQPLAALEQYDIALGRKPDFFEALVARANTLCTLDRFDESLKYYREAARRRPDRFEVYSDMGTAFFRVGRYEEALVFYAEALRRQPDAALVHVSMANTLRRLGRNAEARAHERTAKELQKLGPRPGFNKLVTPGFGPR